MISKKIGQCIVEKEDSKCVRAEGFIIYYKYVDPNQSWRLSNPVNVIVEDSCAKHKNSNFLDARPFWHTIPIPH